MLNLRKKIDQDKDKKPPQKRHSLRSQLLAKEVPDIGANTPPTCCIVFSDVDNLRMFTVVVTPDEGLWKNGRFSFDVTIPEEYNMKPPHVLCRTKVWHPNIALSDGGVCLSLLRPGTLDGMGWTPARTLKEVVWGIDSLFSDLLNPDDPLNVEAAEQYKRDREGFRRRVKHFIQQEQQHRR